MGTQPFDASSLSEPLRSALEKEIDPNESIRWCGQPSPAFEFRRAVPAAMTLAAVCLMLGVFFCLAAVSTWQELRGLEPMLGTSDNTRPSWLFVFLAGSLGLIVLAAAGYFVGHPWRLRKTAERTMYAVTNSRVLELIVSSTEPDASTRTQAVEPGHPLHIRRTTNPDGRGDIFLYPTSTNTAKLSLHSLADSREVERIIRTTFDPPRA